jgi:hypothetical protein
LPSDSLPLEDNSSPAPLPRGKPRVTPRILLTLLFFVAFEGLLFHSGMYAYIIEPDSTAGVLENRLRNEILRPKSGRNQVLAVGDSRMSLVPRIANEMAPPSGYTFGSISVAGTAPRCWYYELRYVDPAARRYAAIVIPSDDYDDQEQYPDARDSDLHYVLARLEIGDLFEFPLSHRDRKLQWTAFRAILLKGYAYKRDFQEFLSHPLERLARVRLYKEGSAQWFDDYQPTDDSLAGLQIDWQHKTARYPDRFTVEQRQLVEEVVARVRPADTGRGTAYFRYWYGRILDRYTGSGTKIIFLRLPRAPIPPPDYPPKLNGAVRQLASKPDVVVLNEHLFDELERPELFFDPAHMNREGSARFSRILAAEVRKVLLPPKS